MYNPKVSNPNLSTNIPQTRSDGYQPPFYFGGSPVPSAFTHNQFVAHTPTTLFQKTAIQGRGFSTGLNPRKKMF